MYCLIPQRSTPTASTLSLSWSPQKLAWRKKEDTPGIRLPCVFLFTRFGKIRRNGILTRLSHVKKNFSYFSGSQCFNNALTTKCPYYFLMFDTNILAMPVIVGNGLLRISFFSRVLNKSPNSKQASRSSQPSCILVPFTSSAAEDRAQSWKNSLTLRQASVSHSCHPCIFHLCLFFFFLICCF